MALATGQGHLTSWTATPHISSVTQLCFLKQPLDIEFPLTLTTTQVGKLPKRIVY